MASVREIKRRISSVKNIGQVTRAMEAVSASRARSSQLQAERSRDYAEKAWEILVNLSGQPGSTEHPLLKVPETLETVDIVLISSDRGLAGAYNSNIIRVAEEFVEELGVPVRWMTIGRKGRDYLLRRRANVVAEVSGLSGEVTTRDIKPIADVILNDFLSGLSQQVFIAYTNYVNVLTQKPTVVHLLPLSPINPDMVASEYLRPDPTQTVKDRVYLYEPGAAAILDEIVPRFTLLQIYQAVLEANASEHAARMIAMRNATENAAALVDDLTLAYNKARQAAITAEILDIVGGVEAMASEDDSHKVVQEADVFIASTAAAING